MEVDNLNKELKLAVKAAKDAGKLLIENKKELNLSIDSDPKDTKLKADISSEDLIIFRCASDQFGLRFKIIISRESF